MPVPVLREHLGNPLAEWVVLEAGNREAIPDPELQAPYGNALSTRLPETFKNPPPSKFLPPVAFRQLLALDLWSGWPGPHLWLQMEPRDLVEANQTALPLATMIGSGVGSVTQTGQSEASLEDAAGGTWFLVVAELAGGIWDHRGFPSPPWADRLPETKAPSWEKLRDGGRLLSTPSETRVAARPGDSSAPWGFSSCVPIHFVPLQ